MAIYEGVRRPSILVPRVAGPAVLPRRRVGPLRRSRGRSGRLPVLLGGIVVAFVLAFFSLAQTVRVTATDYQVDQLAAQRDRLVAMQQELLSDLNRLGREPAIRRQAIDLGLGPLGEPLIVRSR